MRALSLLALALLLPPLAGCTRAAGAADTGGRLVASIDGISGPESVRYDAEQDVFFVSAIRGYGSIADDNGYILRVSAGDPGEMSVFVHAGAPGVRLDAPKGMTISGDTLWVADIHTLRGFHRRTGAPVASIDLAPHGAMLLNDVVAAPDGSLLITDTGILMSDLGVIYQDSGRIYLVAPDRSVRVLTQDPALAHPNGIAWDAANNRWIVVSFAPFHSQVYALQPDGSGRQVLFETIGRFDGVEVLADGRIAATAWNDSTVFVLAGETRTRVGSGLVQPADLGYDSKRNRLAVPLVTPGRIDFFTQPD